MSREAYVKYTWRIRGLEVVVGLQWHDSENPYTLSTQLKNRIANAMSAADTTGVRAIKVGLERVLDTGWGERAFFIEIRDGDDCEIQVFDPRGFMKARCDCPCKQPPKRVLCPKCFKCTSGGHERDSSDWCHCGYDD